VVNVNNLNCIPRGKKLVYSLENLWSSLIFKNYNKLTVYRTSEYENYCINYAASYFWKLTFTNDNLNAL